MDIESRLIRLDRRQEACIAAIGALGEIMATMDAKLDVLMEWLNHPPSTAVPDALAALTAAVQEQTRAITHLAARVNAIPSEIRHRP